MFQQHPDWFIKDAAGAPLRSDRVTFGGWRRGPWYALDGTHPEAQRHLEQRLPHDARGVGLHLLQAGRELLGRDARRPVPRSARDAHRGVPPRHAGDPARLRATAFILGCNHPIWPSIGLIHGSRSSNDIKRTWDRIETTARQNLSRNWQNGRLWWNDPDAVVLASDLTDAECQFHATAIYASGGMVLSGDDLTKLPPARAAMLRKLLPPTGVAAAFEDDTLRVGIGDGLPACAHDVPVQLGRYGRRRCRCDLPQPATVTDYWTDESLGRRQGACPIEMAPRSARLLKWESS